MFYNPKDEVILKDCQSQTFFPETEKVRLARFLNNQLKELTTVRSPRVFFCSTCLCEYIKDISSSGLYSGEGARKQGLEKIKLTMNQN